MLPRGTAARPLHQLRQQGEDRGRVAAGGGRLAGGQADFALRQGEAGQRVHQQQHVLALVAEVFGDRRGGGGRMDADQGRLVAGGHDHHALGQSLRAQVALDELVDLAAPLADQGDDDHVGRRVAGHHPQESRSCPRPSPRRSPSAAPCRRSTGRRSRGSRSTTAGRSAGGRRGAAAGGRSRRGRPAPAAACRRRRFPGRRPPAPTARCPPAASGPSARSRTRLP